MGYYPNHHCGGTPVGRHRSLTAAQIDCDSNSKCNCIQDLYCNGGEWALRIGIPEYAPDYTDCAWMKGNVKFLSIPYNSYIKELIENLHSYFTLCS